MFKTYMSLKSPSVVSGRLREHVAGLLQFGHRGISEMGTGAASNDATEDDLIHDGKMSVRPL